MSDIKRRVGVVAAGVALFGGGLLIGSKVIESDERPDILLEGSVGPNSDNRFDVRALVYLDCVERGDRRPQVNVTAEVATNKVSASQGWRGRRAKEYYTATNAVDCDDALDQAVESPNEVSRLIRRNVTGIIATLDAHGSVIVGEQLAEEFEKAQHDGVDTFDL